MENEVLALLRRANPDKVATMFSTSVAALATFGAAIVAYSVGRNASHVAAEEKRATLSIADVAWDGVDRLSFRLLNAGATHATWVVIRVALSKGIVDDASIPLLRSGDDRMVRIALNPLGAERRVMVAVAHDAFHGRRRREDIEFSLGAGRPPTQRRVRRLWRRIPGASLIGRL